MSNAFSDDWPNGIRDSTAICPADSSTRASAANRDHALYGIPELLWSIK